MPRVPLFCWTLHNHNSPADWERELFKSSKDVGSFVVYIFFELEKSGFWFSCGWCHNWGRFTHFVRGHRALSVKPMTQFFDSNFYWKLGCNLVIRAHDQLFSISRSKKLWLQNLNFDKKSSWAKGNLGHIGWRPLLASQLNRRAVQALNRCSKSCSFNLKRKIGKF